MHKNECLLPKCAVINDLSGFGRCSLTVAIPILSALGIQACPLPTAILSNHTGYNDFYFQDFTNHMQVYFEKWQALSLHFDSIYTGFLGNEKQIEIILEFIHRFKKDGTLLFVDPVMGDHGGLYSTYNSDLCSGMKRLVAKADIITPNLTEACILADVPYINKITKNDHTHILEIGEKLLTQGPETVIITGVKTDDKVYNFVLNKKNNERFYEESDFVACEYCGTGDVFASLMCGYLTAGMDHREALKKATDFLVRTIKYSNYHHVDPLDGVAFETFLKNL